MTLRQHHDLLPKLNIAIRARPVAQRRGAHTDDPQRMALAHAPRLHEADDECGEWPVVVAEKENLTHLLSELPFFEYFVFDCECAHAFFDTHQNTLIESVALDKA